MAMRLNWRRVTNVARKPNTMKMEKKYILKERPLTRRRFLARI